MQQQQVKMENTIFICLTLVVTCYANPPPKGGRLETCLAARDSLEAIMPEGGPGEEALRELEKLCDKAYMIHDRIFVALEHVDDVSGNYDDVTNSSSRQRRMVLADPWAHWDKGIVPYVINWLPAGQDSYDVLRAMRVYERLTCIRFKHWHSGLNTELGLNHQNYVHFVNTGGCYSSKGNRHNQGNTIACCGGEVCIHELGHLLGAYHEHMNILGKGLQRQNHQNVDPSKEHDFSYGGENDLTTGYDFNSIMKYDSWGFSKNGKDTISWLMQGLPGAQEWYYLLQEISMAHRCDAMYCPNFKLNCINDGYRTLVDGVCACRCPNGLDPSTGCATVLGQEGSQDSCSDRCGEYDLAKQCQCNSICETKGNCCPDFNYRCDSDATPDAKWYSNYTWPAGQYALPRPAGGCPTDDFVGGQRIHTGAAPGPCINHNARGCPYWGPNGCIANPTFMNKECPVTCGQCNFYGSHASHSYLAGTVTNDQIEHQFCVKENGTHKGDKWPSGQYCMFMKGGSCPEGLEASSATFTDDDAHSSATNTVNGSLPDGTFGNTTTFQFCCNTYGFQSDELNLPPTKPFALLAKTSCHSVKGMHAYSGYTGIRNVGPVSITGSAPVQSMKVTDSSYKIPYCYYVPTVKTCGDVIHLTPENSTASLAGVGGAEQACNWLIKGPEGSRIVLDFARFSIASDDKIEVRWNRLAQPPQTLRGDSYKKSISSLYNNIMVTYETARAAHSYFNATVTLIHEGNSCYNLTDKGHTYNGKINFTRQMVPCLPWHTLPHCPHNPLIDSDLLDDLSDNYCRMPDTVDGIRPWCYTGADNCQRDYCDVCRHEQLFDTSPSCVESAKLGFCEKDPKARSMCAKTCEVALGIPPKPPAAVNVSCSPPDATIGDGAMVGVAKASYAVGEAVQYKCTEPGATAVMGRYCLTSGDWTSLNYVCTKCEEGWILYGDTCYLYQEQASTYPMAKSVCNSHNSLVAMPKTSDLNNFLKGLDPWKGMWIGATDGGSEGHYKWDDGSDVSWAPWKSGQPDNYYNEDCIFMIHNGLWEDLWCNHAEYHPFTCSKPATNTSTVCADLSDVCLNMYTNDPNICTKQAFFMNRNCKETCGVCNIGNCKIPAPTDQAELVGTTSTIAHGAQVTYKCKSGANFVSGTTVRGCKSDGNLTGDPLVCEVVKEVLTDSVGLNAQSHMGSKIFSGHSITGPSPHFKVPAAGNISRWDFYSTSAGKGTFQVWRPVAGNANSYTFIGENAVTTPAAVGTSLYVPEDERISVQVGDLLGIYYGTPPNGVGYYRCTGASNPEFKVIHSSLTGPPYTAGQAYPFKFESREQCRQYQIRAAITP